MGKVLFWIVVLGLGWLAWSLIRVSQRKQERAQVEADEPASGLGGPAKKRKDKQGAEEIVACAHCGVYLPASTALKGKGGPYCCVEHRDAARG